MGREKAHLLEVDSPYALIWEEGPSSVRHSEEDLTRFTAALNWTVGLEGETS